jgi:hypothetical protein
MIYHNVYHLESRRKEKWGGVESHARLGLVGEGEDEEREDDDN